MRIRTAAAAVLLAGLVLTGCADPATESPASSSQASDDGLLAAHDLTGLDSVQIIERLDSMPIAERPTTLMASVQPNALVLTDDQERQVSLPMPEGEVYLSAAPYRQQTHDCYFHSLTTCRGELRNADVQVTLTDADGKVLMTETRRTFDNGFVGLWVPRGVEGTLTIEHDGQTGTVAISTVKADDPTCLTTLRLT